MALKAKLFDPADYLINEGTITEYLRLALESNDPHEIVQSLSDVTRARGGIAQLASDTGIPAGHLEQALSETGNPDLATLAKILTALGVRLSLSVNDSESVAA